MAEITEEKNKTQVNLEGTPPPTPEEVAQLSATKVKLESEISGLEGTKNSILEDIERVYADPAGFPGPVETPPAPPVDVEALKAELTGNFKNQLAEAITPILENNAKITQELIDSKKIIVDGITARMASASGSKGPASPESTTDDTVELSDGEKQIIQELGIKNPRYLKDADVT